MSALTRNMSHHRHRNSTRTAPRPAAPQKIDQFMSGEVTDARIRKLLEATYERFQADFLKHRTPGADENEELYTALQNCYFSDEHVTVDGRRTIKRLTKRERLIRIAGACWNRVSTLDHEPVSLESDLSLLDALQDVIEDSGTSEWTINPDCEIDFV